MVRIEWEKSTTITMLLLTACAGQTTYLCPSSQQQVISSSAGRIISSTSLNDTQYSSVARCTWLIAPAQGGAITLSFEQFQTESNRDILRLYSCGDILCNSQTEISGSPFSGFSLPPTKTFYTGVVKIVFTSDISLEYLGFKASFFVTAISTSTSKAANYQTTSSTIEIMQTRNAKR